MKEGDLIYFSKFLSQVLRHRPGRIGVTLDKNGWTDVSELIEKTNASGRDLDLDTLKIIVETDNKKRFAFNETFDKIRANQGHSVKVDLDYAAQMPPFILYHGTTVEAAKLILKSGLNKRKRHHVHLSQDIKTATAVGKRHGEPFIFEVAAKAMYNDKFEFFLSENNVWLTDNVPPKYLKPYQAVAKPVNGRTSSE